MNFFPYYCTFQVSHKSGSEVQQLFNLVVGNVASLVGIRDETEFHQRKQQKVFLHNAGGSEEKLHCQRF